MQFNSIQFLIFFPCVCLVYFIIPHRVRYIFLLICSYFFYMCWNPRYALLLLASTVITYASGILIGNADKVSDDAHRLRSKKCFVALSFISNLGILFFFKYFDFAVDSITSVLSYAGVAFPQPAFDVVLPVGISFYTFQALSYTVDVYRKEIEPQRNFFKYALFVSFFPQLVAGPIERSTNLIKQIDEKHYFDFKRVRSGLLLMLYGFFQKVVVSEYLAIAVDSIYDSYDERTGFQLLLATVLFAFQIYCDFDAYSNIAIGAARVMGFKLMKNFKTPYFASSVAEFWRRWHISLTTWFRDYLYIPLGGNRKGSARKRLNCMIVFLVSGLWHGASWHYVIWGGLNGIYQVIGEALAPARGRAAKKLKLNADSLANKFIRIIITFVLVDFSWIFFRAESFSQSLTVIKKIFGFGGGAWFTPGDNLEMMGYTGGMLAVLLVSLIVLLFVDICKYRGFNLAGWVVGRKLAPRWVILYAAIFGILIFGIYGSGYDASDFIYFQF